MTCFDKNAKKTTSKNKPPTAVPVQSKMVKIGGTIHPFDGLLVWRKTYPQSHSFLLTCSCDLHCGHCLFHDFCFGALTWLALRAACNCSFRDSSANWTAHWGWMPSLEYDDSPQTGHVFVFRIEYSKVRVPFVILPPFRKRVRAFAMPFP